MMRTNEVAEQDRDDDGTLEVFPPAQAHRPAAVAKLYEHAEVYNTAWKLAGQLVMTTMVPKRFNGREKQGDATAAILYGNELGLNPIQSLQRVIPIHGMPSLEARTMVGLLKMNGYKVRTTAQSDESVTVEGESPDGDRYSSTWTMARARLAGYVPTPRPGVTNPRPDEKNDWVVTEKTWNGRTTTSIAGNMKYITDPQTMLKAKAQAETCRELAPDVLMGIAYSREELESERQDQFDRMDERGAAPARTREVAMDDILTTEEVPLPDDDDAGPVPVPADEDELRAAAAADAPTQAYAEEQAAAGQVAPETPAGAVTEDQGDGAPDTVAPAEHQPDPEPVDPAEPVVTDEDVKRAAVEREAKAASSKIAAKRNTAPAADPDRPKSRMRKALEKRLYGLLGDAGYSDDANRDGKIALYRAILERPDVESTDDLDDAAVGKVADRLYSWQEQNVLADEVEAIIAAAVAETIAPAAVAETIAPAAADASTSEGNE